MIRQVAYCDQYQNSSNRSYQQNGLFLQNENLGGYNNVPVPYNKQLQQQQKFPQIGNFVSTELSSNAHKQILGQNYSQHIDDYSYSQTPYFQAQQLGFQFDLKAHTNGAIDPSFMEVPQHWAGLQACQYEVRSKAQSPPGSNSNLLGTRSLSQKTDQSLLYNAVSWSTPRASVRAIQKSGDDQMSEALMQELVFRLQQKEQSSKVQEITEKFIQLASSRTVSILLRTLHKQGQTCRALKLFDWLRTFTNEKCSEYSLCDVFTYTAAISLCVNQFQYDKAIQLSKEMQIRKIQKNVYTYTALMNVCIKCGQLQAALDVYKEMSENKCPLNVVTFNTLIDVFGKLGRYEEALRVFDKMSQEGVEPVTRTYNTLMIACNTCNNWQETLKVYNKMVQHKHTPNTTTYNALITAYSKAGRLEKVLEIYQDMISKGCERSVITYSSLINACEKAGQWELALYVFNEMRLLGCQPNTITFNSIISACSQGGQCQKAEELLDAMKQQKCKPDVVTYTSLIRTYEKAGNYCGAYEKFIEMQNAGVKADAIAYIAIIEALYESGVVVCQVHAASLYRQAIQKRVIHAPLTMIGDASKLVMSTSSAPVAMLNFYCSMLDIRDKLLKGTSAAKAIGAENFFVMVSKVKGKEYGENVLKECLQNIFQYLQCPLTIDSKPSNGKLQINGLSKGFQSGYNLIGNNAQGVNNSATEIWECQSQQLCNWLLEKGQLFQIYSEGNCAKSKFNTQQEYDNIMECQNVMDAILKFELSHCLNLQNMGQQYIEQRCSLLNKATKIFGETGLAEEEVIHDGMLLFDRAMSSPHLVLDEQLFELAIVTSVYIALKLSLKKIPTLEQVAKLVGFPINAMERMELSICQALNNDTSTVCALRNLKVLLERLGMQYSDKKENMSLYGGNIAHQGVDQSQKNTNFLNYTPSIIASVNLFIERKNKGIFPYWPSSLKNMTKYSHVKSLDFTLALAKVENQEN